MFTYRKCTLEWQGNQTTQVSWFIAISSFLFRVQKPSNNWETTMKIDYIDNFNFFWHHTNVKWHISKDSETHSALFGRTGQSFSDIHIDLDQSSRSTIETIKHFTKTLTWLFPHLDIWHFHKFWRMLHARKKLWAIYYICRMYTYMYIHIYSNMYWYIA